MDPHETSADGDWPDALRAETVTLLAAGSAGAAVVLMVLGAPPLAAVCVSGAYFLGAVGNEAFRSLAARSALGTERAPSHDDAATNTWRECYVHAVDANAMMHLKEVARREGVELHATRDPNGFVVWIDVEQHRRLTDALGSTVQWDRSGAALAC